MPGTVQNRWTTRDDPAFAAWEAALPAEGGLDFSRALLRLGREERVYRVLEAPAPSRFEAAGGRRYEDLLAEGALPFDFGSGGIARTAAGQLRTPGVVSWHAPGGVVEGEVEDLGAKLASLRPGDVDWGGRFMAPAPPVTITGRRARRDAERPLRVRVALFCDVWFPWVLGFLEEAFPAPNARKMYDNRALAARHTPRLNRFLAGAADAAAAAGGRWSVLEPEGAAERYADVVGPRGIELSAR